MDSFSHPFRFSGGKAVYVDADSDAMAAQLIASAIKTDHVELWNTPDYGSDPAEFATLDTAGLMYSISLYHPSILIHDLSETVTDSGTVVKVTFSKQR